MRRTGTHVSIAIGRILVSGLAGLLLSTSWPGRAAASTVITSCTEAELDNALVAGGTVTFNCGAAPVTIILHTMKTISTNVDLQGGGLITLSGANTISHFQVFAGRSLSLTGITLTKGFGPFGALQNFGTLSITNSLLVDNQASASGGAIQNFGTLTITTSVLSNNRAAEKGGAIDEEGLPVTISGSQLTGNSANVGGGLFSVVGTTITIDSSQITSNEARSAQDAFGGGGIRNEGTLTLTNSVVGQNKASFSGAGVANLGTLHLDHVTISGNVARLNAGLFSNGIGTLQDVTFQGNSATTVANVQGSVGGFGSTSTDQTTMRAVTFVGNTGGAIQVAGRTLDLIDVTISGNAGKLSGGIQVLQGLTRLTNVTIADNSAGVGSCMGGQVCSPGNNIWIQSLATGLEMTGTIIQGSSADPNCAEKTAMITSKGFNLSTDRSCNLTSVTDKAGMDPQLRGLAANGGPTQTRLLNPGSPAIDASQCFSTVPTDQRGVARPQGPACDMGAVEMRPEDFAAPTSLVASVLPSSRSVALGSTATAFVTIINTGSTEAFGVGISLSTGIPATLTYQTTNPTTNTLTGTPNIPADILPGDLQTYVIAITPTGPFGPTEVALTFAGANTGPVATLTGINTLLLSASMTPVPDIVALAATPTHDGIVNIPGTAGTGVFAVATVNVGAAGSITASADTGAAPLAATVALCQTDPGTSACLAPPGPTVTTTIAGGATSTFGVFVTGAGTVPFDPATNRVFVRFKDAGTVTRGSTSVAVRTQ